MMNLRLIICSVARNEELLTFAQNEPLCRPFSYDYGQGRKEVRVLTALGVRIFRGIMSCVLQAHEAGIAYGGSFSVQVSVFERWNGTTIAPETAGVRIIGERVVPCDHDAQKDDYQQLRKIIKEAFGHGRGSLPLHVDMICKKLDNLAGTQINLPNGSTQLLQALVATVDPLVMATMWWNLVRFQDSLGPKPSQEKKTSIERKEFDSIVNKAPTGSSGWRGLNYDGLFKKTTWGSATDLLSIARNWFTHFPEEVCRADTKRFFLNVRPYQRNLFLYFSLQNSTKRFSLQKNNRASTSQQNRAPASQQGPKLHELDYYFSLHFPDFMGNVLTELYFNSNDNSTHLFHTKDLTRA